MNKRLVMALAVVLLASPVAAAPQLVAETELSQRIVLDPGNGGQSWLYDIEISSANAESIRVNHHLRLHQIHGTGGSVQVDLLADGEPVSRLVDGNLSKGQTRGWILPSDTHAPDTKFQLLITNTDTTSTSYVLVYEPINTWAEPVVPVTGFFFGLVVAGTMLLALGAVLFTWLTKK